MLPLRGTKLDCHEETAKRGSNPGAPTPAQPERQSHDAPWGPGLLRQGRWRQLVFTLSTSDLYV